MAPTEHAVNHAKRLTTDAVGPEECPACWLDIIPESCGSTHCPQKATLAEAMSAVEEIAPPTPLGALKFRMEQGGHSQADLAKLIGSRARASEILAGKRELSKAQIAIVSDTWDIPARSLLGPDATNWKWRALTAEAEVKRLRAALSPPSKIAGEG